MIKYKSIYGNRVYIYSLNHPNKRKNGYMLRSRIVMEKHLGRYLNSNEVVHHKDENSMNDKISNLELHTFSSHRKIHFCGANNPNAKLNNAKVRTIRKLWRAGYKQIELARMFNIHKSNVNNIIKERTWRI